MLDWSQSQNAASRARRVMPGGNTRASAFETPHPVYLASGEGAYVTDVDGNRYIDFQNNFTTLIHGHGHSGVIEALEVQLRKGLCFSNPTLSEIELAEILCYRVPYFDQVRFTNTGSEAVMMAIKAARALTGRQLIAKCEGAYHGNYDFVEMSVEQAPQPWSGGVPAGQPAHRGVAAQAQADVVVIPFNDLDASRAILDQVQGKLAAIVVDPMPSRAGLVPIDPGYLGMVRDFTSADGCLMISDEVLSFRLGYSGALGETGIHPDLCAFGKIVGGGLPIGAIAGSAEVMQMFDPSKGTPPVAHAGTFTANPMSVVAGAAALKAMTPSAFDDLNEMGELTRTALRQVLRDTATSGVVTGAGSLFRIFLGRAEVHNYRDAFGTKEQSRLLAALAEDMRQHGVLISRIGLGALSTPMGHAEINRLRDAFYSAIRAVLPLAAE